MNELQVQLEVIDAELRNEKQRGALADGEKIAILEQDRQNILDQLQVAQVAQVKEEVIGVLAQEISDLDMFGALFPPDEYKEVFSITVYEEKRQSFNQLAHAYASDIQSRLVEQLQAKHTEDLTAKEVAYRELAQRNADLEQKQIESEINIAQLNSIIEQKDAEITSQGEQLKLKQDHIDQLRVDLERAPAPKVTFTDVAPSKPSQSFKELLQETRNTSIKSAKDIVLAGSSFRGKVTFGGMEETPTLTPPAIGGSESTDSFRYEVPTAYIGNGGIHTSEVDALAFRAEGEEATTNGLAGDTTLQARDERSVTREEFEALKQRVEALEGKATGAAA